MSQLALPEGRPPLPAPAFADHLISLHVGSCLELLRCIDTESVDHAITDPPYSAEAHENARTMRRDGMDDDGRLPMGNGGAKLVDFPSVTLDDLYPVFEEIGRVVRQWVIATMDWTHIAAFEKRPPRGLEFVRFAAWVKTNPMPQLTGDRPGQGFEGICVMHKAGRAMRWNGHGKAGLYLHASVRGKARINSTQKPVGLLKEVVADFTCPGETIVDAYAGGGTTLVAARALGRRAIGMELLQAEADRAIARFQSEKDVPMHRVSQRGQLRRMKLRRLKTARAI